MSLSKNQKAFMYATVMEVILSTNTINHQKILSLNTLKDEQWREQTLLNADFIAAYYHTIKSHISKKKTNLGQCKHFCKSGDCK